MEVNYILFEKNHDMKHDTFQTMVLVSTKKKNI